MTHGLVCFDCEKPFPVKDERIQAEHIKLPMPLAGISSFYLCPKCVRSMWNLAGDPTEWMKLTVRVKKDHEDQLEEEAEEAERLLIQAQLEIKSLRKEIMELKWPKEPVAT